MASLKTLKIKIESCKHILKELHSYEKEVEREVAKIAAMKEKGVDEYDIKQQAIEGMKFVRYELSQVAGDNENSSLDGLVRVSNHLVTSLSEKVPHNFNLSLNGASSRACKYVLNTLMQIFQIRKLAYTVNEGILHSLITKLLLWLLNERVPMMDDGSQLLNVLMLKILVGSFMGMLPNVDHEVFICHAR